MNEKIMTNDEFTAEFKRLLAEGYSYHMNHTGHYCSYTFRDKGKNLVAKAKELAGRMYTIKYEGR